MTSKILLVDNEISILDALSCLLRELGFAVRTAAGPAEALDLVSRETFHMAFVDNVLGTAKGIDLIGKLGQLDPELHFVIMTGSPNIETAISAIKKGVSDFLCKPFHIKDLLTSINHVNSKRDLDQHRKSMLSRLELKVEEKTAELKQTYLSVMTALSRMVERKDLGTYGHSMRVSNISVLIAESLGLSAPEIEDIRAASLLHDIGKIGISDVILGKQGPLTLEEFRIIHGHPEKGVEILQPLKHFEALLPTILHHHERYDGSGYPQGLSGNAIPFPARIIAVADTYDAILSDRPYRLASSEDSAVRVLSTMAGKQFDRRVTDAFMNVADGLRTAGVR